MSSLVLQVHHPCRRRRGKRKKGCGLLFFPLPSFFPSFLLSFLPSFPPSFHARGMAKPLSIAIAHSRCSRSSVLHGSWAAEPAPCAPTLGSLKPPKTAPFLALPNELCWLNEPTFKQERVGQIWGFFSLNLHLPESRQCANPGFGMPRSEGHPFRRHAPAQGDKNHAREPGRAAISQVKTRSCLCSPTSGKGTPNPQTR